MTSSIIVQILFPENSPDRLFLLALVRLVAPFSLLIKLAVDLPKRRYQALNPNLDRSAQS